jgi:hypothetical protein
MTRTEHIHLADRADSDGHPVKSVSGPVSWAS